MFRFNQSSQRSLSEEKKTSSPFKSGSTITWERAFHNLWFISSANRFYGLKVHYVYHYEDLNTNIIMWALHTI